MTEAALLAAQNKALEAENARLREENAQLLAQFADLDWISPPELRLTAGQEGLLRILIAREFATRDGLMTALFGLRLAEEVPEVRIIDVYICKIRQKLAPFGVEIETRWGQGYRLSPENRDRLLAIGGAS